MTARRSATAVAVLAVVLAGCGDTYVDTSATTVPSDSTGVTLPPIDPDAPLDDLLGEISELMFDLDERIIEQDGEVDALARIDELWVAAEATIRANDPDDIFNFEQAIELARSGVERRRPADASKGYKIFVDVSDAYLGSA